MPTATFITSFTSEPPSDGAMYNSNPNYASARKSLTKHQELHDNDAPQPAVSSKPVCPPSVDDIEMPQADAAEEQPQEQVQAPEKPEKSVQSSQSSTNRASKMKREYVEEEDDVYDEMYGNEQEAASDSEMREEDAEGSNANAAEEDDVEQD